MVYLLFPLCTVSLISEDSIGMAAHSFSHGFASERDRKNTDRDLTEVPSTSVKTVSAVSPVVYKAEKLLEGGTPKLFGLSYSFLHSSYLLVVCHTSLRDCSALPCGLPMLPFPPALTPFSMPHTTSSSSHFSFPSFSYKRI